MTYASRDALLGASDIKEKDIELPTVGLTVKVRSLAAAYSNEAHSEALEFVTVEHKGRPERSARVNTVRLETLKVLHGLVEPKLNSIEDATVLSQRLGSAWQTIVKEIDELSGLDEETVERTEAMFRSGGRSEERPSETRPAGAVPNGSGDRGSGLPVRAGA